jgi:hypothetical protein
MLNRGRRKPLRPGTSRTHTSDNDRSPASKLDGGGSPASDCDCFACKPDGFDKCQTDSDNRRRTRRSRCRFCGDSICGADSPEESGDPLLTTLARSRGRLRSSLSSGTRPALRRPTSLSFGVVAVVVALGVGAVGAAPIIVSTTQTEVTIGGLSCGTQYRVRVNVAGNSKVTTLNPVTQPCPPPQAPPPPPSNAYVYDAFCDGATPWTKNVVNRYRTAFVGADPYFACDDLSGGPLGPWLGGSGAWDGISTPYGSGFKFVVGNETQVSSGGRRAEMHDYNHTGAYGQQQVWRGHIMLPAQSYPPNTDWNVLWELKDEADLGGPALGGIGVDGSNQVCMGPCFYVSNIPCDVAQNCRHRLTGPVIVPKHWYAFEYRVKWSTGSDGYFEALIDGAYLGRFDGPTNIHTSDPVMQFGFYGNLLATANTVYHGSVSVEILP